MRIVMNRRSLVAVVLVIALLLPAVAPVAATGPGNTGPPSDCDDGPGIVGSVTPDFLGDLFDILPVPDFVAEMFGAGDC